jgi:hypothetical protein
MLGRFIYSSFHSKFWKAVSKNRNIISLDLYRLCSITIRERNIVKLALNFREFYIDLVVCYFGKLVSKTRTDISVVLCSGSSVTSSERQFIKLAQKVREFYINVVPLKFLKGSYETRTEILLDLYRHSSN